MRSFQWQFRLEPIVGMEGILLLQHRLHRIMNYLGIITVEAVEVEVVLILEPLEEDGVQR